jgi:hypothetical protein
MWGFYYVARISQSVFLDHLIACYRLRWMAHRARAGRRIVKIQRPRIMAVLLDDGAEPSKHRIALAENVRVIIAEARSQNYPALPKFNRAVNSSIGQPQLMQFGFHWVDWLENTAASSKGYRESRWSQ